MIQALSELFLKVRFRKVVFHWTPNIRLLKIHIRLYLVYLGFKFKIPNMLVMYILWI